MRFDHAVSVDDAENEDGNCNNQDDWEEEETGALKARSSYGSSREIILSDGATEL